MSSARPKTAEYSYTLVFSHGFCSSILQTGDGDKGLGCPYGSSLPVRRMVLGRVMGSAGR